MAAPSDDPELKRWVYAASNSGQEYVLREIKKAKASVDAAAKLENAMRRLENGDAKPQEYDVVRNGVSELRVNADKRWYRLLYGRDGDNFVALSFLVKKQNKLDPNAIDTAENRLKEHLANH